MSKDLKGEKNPKRFYIRFWGGVLVSLVSFIMFVIAIYWWSEIDIWIFVIISVSLGIAFMIFGGSREKLIKWLAEIVNGISGFG